MDVSVFYELKNNFSFAPTCFSKMCCSQQPEENSIKQWFHLLMCPESNYNGWFLFFFFWVKPTLGCGYMSCFIFCAWKNNLLLWPVTEHKCVLLEGVQFQTQSVGSQISFCILLSFVTQGGLVKKVNTDRQSSHHPCKYKQMQTHLVDSDPEISIEWAPWTNTDTPVSSFIERGIKTVHVHTHTPHEGKVPSVWWAVGGWSWPVAFGSESQCRLRVCVSPPHCRHTKTGCVWEQGDQMKGWEVQEKAREKCWNGEFGDVLLRFEIQKSGTWDRDRCGIEMCRDGGRQMRRRWRGGRWNSAPRQLVEGISLGNFLICTLVCLDLWMFWQSRHVIPIIRPQNSKYELHLCWYYSLWVCSTLVWVHLLFVFVLVHHYIHGLSLMLLETPVCNGWKSELPAGLFSNCWSGFCSQIPL